MSNNISKKIKELREQNNITQNKLANDLFIKQQTVAQWENGSRALKADSIISLAKYFNVSTDYLLGLTENTSTNISEIGISNKTGFSTLTVENILNLSAEHKIILDKIINELLKSDLLEKFEELKENNIKYFFIAGDLYENQYIRTSTIEYINKLFLEIDDTQIFIAPGNHDPLLKNSYYNNFLWNKNVHIFGPKFERIETDNIDIYGYGFDDFYCSNLNFNDLKISNPNKINILVIHGTLDGANLEDMQYNSMSTRMLQEKGFDYVALGHIHKNNFKNDGKIIYPGSTIAMGFDELGEHGMVTGEISKLGNKLEFIKLDELEFKKQELDCTELNSIEEIIEKINSINLEENKLYEIILIGKRNFEININEIYKYYLDEKIIKIKNNTKINYNIEKIIQENNLKGLFVKELLNNKNNYNEKIIEKALEIGLEILS